MKNRKRILAAILTAIMTISILPANSFASEAGENDTAEAAVEAVSVSDEEQEVESTVEDISEETASETEEEPSAIDEAEEVSESETTEEAETVTEEEDIAAEEAEETVEADEVVETVEDDIETVDTESEGPRTLKAEGKDYIVTVTYNDSALLPDDVKIAVEEIKENARKYDSYCDGALEAVQKEDEEAEEISYIRLFDITLTDGEGNKVQPETAVDVQIRLKDVKEVEESAQVVHFAGKAETPEVVESEIAGKDVSFEAEGFSIYAVVETGKYARLTVNFNNGTDTLKTMYVKQKDIEDGNLNQVLYDPGVPVESGKKFLGWTEVQEYTLETDGLTIDEVRTAVKKKLNVGIDDGDEVTYYAMMVTSFELYYQDEDENTFKTENLLTAGNSATTTVDMAYTLNSADATHGFIGWKVKGTDEPVYKNGDEITISGDTILVPAIGVGFWLYFDENDGGSGTGNASYTAPQFIQADGGAATRPADPTRPGYTFDNWYDSAEGGNVFDFTNLGKYTPDDQGKITAYAHWTAKQDASYKVIIWAQKVTDDKNADPKTYDYIETYEVTGVPTGTVLTEAELNKSSNNYLTKTDAYFGATDLDHGSKAFKYAGFDVKNGIGDDKNGVNPDDSTVVNVYYDRCLFTLNFFVQGNAPEGYEQGYRYSKAEGRPDVAFGYIDGEMVPLETVKIVGSVSWKEGNSTFSGTKLYRKTGSAGSWFNPEYSNPANFTYVGTTSEETNPTGDYYGQYKDMSGNPFEKLSYTINYINTYKFNGEAYNGQLYIRESGYTKTFTGLYGQDISEGWQTPPGTEKEWKDIAFLSSYTGNLFGDKNLGGVPNTITAYQIKDTNTTIIFWEQNADDNGYTQRDTVYYDLEDAQPFNLTPRYVGVENSGYAWTNSDGQPTNWTTASASDEWTSGKSGSYLHIRYNRVVNDIIYMQGDREIARDANVRYGASLASHKANIPSDSEVQVGENEFFTGWYEDPEGVNPVNWNGTMPNGNKVIYAVVKPAQYHVVVDMDGGQLPNNQSTDFWTEWGVTINDTNFMNATKTDAQNNPYTLIGYYLDEDHTKLWNFDTRLTEASLWYKYDDSQGEDSARNSDFFQPDHSDVGYPRVVGIFRLFARWRNDGILSKGGLNIRYKNPADAPTYVYEDSMHYADQADVITAQAPTEKDWPEGKRFDGWQLKEGAVYQPGDIFVADSEDAEIENEKYWITLTAVYVDKEDRTPTHVTWYKNDGSGGYYHTDGNYGINEAIDIWPAQTRDGYKFLGWAKDVEREEGSETLNTETDETTANFLEYKDGKYYIPGTQTEVTQVAADELLPYEALYAIWQKDQFHIYHSGTGKTEHIDMPEDGVFNITSKVTGGKLYGGYYEFTDSEPHKGKAYTASGITMTPVADTTYYLREVDPNYLKPSVYLIYNTNHNGLIQDLYGFVNVDDAAEYNDVGMFVDGSKTSVKNNLATAAINITRGGEPYQTLDSSSLFDMTGATFGYANLKASIVGGATVQIGGYYVTKDNVQVTGYRDRMIRFADNDVRYDAPIFTGWNSAGNTKLGLKTVGTTNTPAVLTSARPLFASRMLTISAPSEKMEYTITKIYDNGTDEEVVEEGDYTGVISYASRSGYLFAGWYKDAAFTEPADFSAVSSDMTVYAKYVKNSDVSVAFTSKSLKSRTATLNATVTVKGQADFENVTVSTKGTSTSVLTGRIVKKTGSGKNVKYTTQYKGTATVKGVSLISSFTASVNWTTPDGTAVTGPAYNCNYILGLVTVN